MFHDDLQPPWYPPLSSSMSTPCNGWHDEPFFAKQGLNPHLLAANSGQPAAISSQDRKLFFAHVHATFLALSVFAFITYKLPVLTQS